MAKNLKIKEKSSAGTENLLTRIVRNLRSLHVRVYRKGYFGTGGKSFALAVRFQKSIRNQEPEILMFGDSVSIRVAHQDHDKRTLGQMVTDELAPRRTHVTSFTSFTAFMYGAFIGLARAMKAEPKWIILPYNLRCSSPQWDACPIWQYTQEQAVLQALVNDPDSKPGAVAPVFLDENIYNSVAFSSPLSKWRTVGEFRRAAKAKSEDPDLAIERLKNLLVLHYGMPIRDGHRQLAFLTGAIRDAAEMGAKILVYLTPVNVEFMRELWGDALLEILNHNRRQVRGAIERAGLMDKVIFSDWADAFPSDHFFHREETTEHLAEAGRLRLATMISERIGEVDSQSGNNAATS